MTRRGQALVQYFLVALVIAGVAFAFVPLFEQTNTMLVNNAGRKSTNQAQDTLVNNTIIPNNNIVPGTPGTLPPIPGTTPGPGIPPTGTLCGPFGCGTINIPGEEAICGFIPGTAGVLPDGCWICSHGSSFWYWETNLTTCGNYWYSDLSSLCASSCSYNPPFFGIDFLNSYCYVCTNSGTNTGFWQRRGYNTDTAHPLEMMTSGCTDFWNNPPGACRDSDISYATGCGCSGVPPFYGSLVSPANGSESCWICDGTDWINTRTMGYCNSMWLGDSCPVYAPSSDDFPSCGCISEPPNNQRGPSGRGAGLCWVCNSGSWVKEDDAADCNDFWINGNCPLAASSGLICGDANPLPNPDPLPVLNPGYNNCWLCSNPKEAYLGSSYNSTENQLYVAYGVPCNSFWVNTPEDYPAYNDIPGAANNVDTVCANPLPLTDGVKKPGIVQNVANNQWGCWACTSGGSYDWIYWYGGRFNWLGDGPPNYLPQYKACNDFWVQGAYPASIPADSPAPLACGNLLPSTDPGYNSCYLCTNPSENYRLSTYNTTGNTLFTTYGPPCSDYWYVPEYPAYLNIPNNPDDVETVCSNSLPLTDGAKKPGIVYDNASGHWGCWACTNGGAYTWIYWLDGRFDHIADPQYQACHNFWMEGTYPTSIPAPPAALSACTGAEADFASCTLDGITVKRISTLDFGGDKVYVAIADLSSRPWGVFGITTAATGTGIGAGWTNTGILTPAYDSYNDGHRIGTAAMDCRAQGANWYLPSLDELNIMYQNKNNIGGFGITYYWSSTDNDNSFMRGQNFEFGIQYLGDKTQNAHFRCLRRFSGSVTPPALPDPGPAWSWGVNAYGYLGDTVASRYTPDTVKGGHTFTKVSGAMDTACGIDASGTAWCWGLNDMGQLGNGTTSGFGSNPTPVEVVGGHVFKDISAAQYHSCGIDTAGKAWCWGYNWNGMLGDGTTGDSPTPVAVTGGHTFIQIATGSASTCAIDTAGVARCWGNNFFGQLGNGVTSGSSDNPTPVLVVGNHVFKDISISITGASHRTFACALDTSGAAWCWGNDFWAGLGAGSYQGDMPTPVGVVGGHVFIDIDAGPRHACGVDTAGSAWCWGTNAFGAAGDPSGTSLFSPKYTPIQVGGGHIFTAISAGEREDLVTLSDTSTNADSQSCALDTSGAAWCWGSNFLGKLGIGTTDENDHPVPVAVGGGRTFTSIDVGGSGIIAIEAAAPTEPPITVDPGSAYGWGVNDTGEVGDGTTASPILTPVAVIGGLSFVQVTGSGAHTLAILEGVAPPVTPPSAPASLTVTPSLAGSVVNVSLSWPTPLGADDYYISNSTDLYATSVITTNTSYIYANFGHDGETVTFRVYAHNSAGMSAGYAEQSAVMPTPPPAVPSAPASLTVTPSLNGSDVDVALSWPASPGATMYYIRNSLDGYIIPVSTASTSYTYSNFGHSGESVTFRVYAANISGTSLDYAEQSAIMPTPSGGGTVTPGPAWDWGDNSRSQAGIGTDLPTSVTSPVAVLDGHTFKLVTSGINQNCGLEADGTAWCWGRGDFGQLGDGNSGINYEQATPVRVQGGHVFQDISIRDHSGCGVDTTGQAWCWGWNNTGQVGDGTTSQRNTPVQVHQGGEIFATIAQGFYHTCALNTAGAAFCWGNDNATGMLGTGNTTARLTPIAVVGGHVFTKIDAGSGHTCALKADGTAWCWGDNGDGECGDLTSGTNRYTPVQVIGHLFVDISTGTNGSHTCGLDASGIGWCWGNNGRGRLGTGDAASRVTPTEIIGGHVFKQVSAGNQHSCGIDTSGDTWCWGYGYHGLMGDGTAEIDRYTPVLVIGGRKFSFIDAGWYQTVAIEAAPPVTPPDAPASLTVTPSLAGSTINVALSWPASAGATGYYIKNSTDGYVAQINNATTSYTYSNFGNAGSSVTFRVYAYNGSGTSSGYAQQSATMPTPSLTSCESGKTCTCTGAEADFASCIMDDINVKRISALDFSGYKAYVATVDLGFRRWGTYNVDTGAYGTGIGAGWTNTNILTPAYDTYNDGSRIGTAAGDCRSYGSNWYLPSLDELHVVSLNKDYIGGFASDYYWSSSQLVDSPIYVWVQYFSYDLQNYALKSEAYYVRCLRRM